MSRADITGFREAAAALRKLAKDFPRAIGPALAKALVPVRDAALAEMPVDTGALAASVAILVRKPRGPRAGAEVRVGDGTGVDYGAHVDLGTRDITADHFLEVAADREQRHAIEILGREIGRILERATPP